LKSSYKYIFL